MAKKKKKYVTSIINNVRVTAVTKREFYSNKEFYKNQGIKSAQKLQEQKNLQSKIKKAETKTRQAAIKAAFELERDKFEEKGYTLKDFLDIDKYFQKRNKAIQKAVKKGKILDTGRYEIPINAKGEINVKRLNYLLKKAKRKISTIQKLQKSYIINNIYELYGNDEYYPYFTKLVNKVSVQQLCEMLETVGLEFFYQYDIEDFEDEARDAFWSGYKELKHAFHRLIVLMADEAKDYEVLGVFGL